MKRLAIAAALAAAALPAVTAANEVGDVYGAVLGSYEFSDNARDEVRGGLGGQSILGIPVNKNFSLEPNIWAESVRRKSDGGEDGQYGGGLDLNIHQSDGRTEGFIVFGGGVERDHLALAIADGLKDNAFKGYADAGAGLVFRISKNFAARVEGRYYLSFDRSDSYPGQHTIGDVHVNAGLVYSLGDVIPTPVKPIPPPPPPPPPPPLPPPPPPPAPCTDSDGDGVCDAVDKCPGTPHGFKVDASGCIIEQTVILRTVNFEFNKATLTSDSKVALDEVAHGLIGQPTLKVEVSGHTDAIGSAPYNLALSKKRAQSVVTYLASKGVPKASLTAKGYGKTKPIADNKTAEGRAENRRVEFKVIAGDAIVEKKTPGGKTVVKVPQRKHPHMPAKPVPKTMP